MRITIRLRDELLRRAKIKAAEDGRTLTSLIEEGLTVVLAERPAGRRQPVELPVSTATGGVLPGVDLNRSSDLEDIMEGL
jgi:hypothetical protein